MRLFARFAVVVALLLLQSCDFFSITKDNVAKPSELVVLKPSKLNVKQSWNSASGSGTHGRYLRLQVAVSGSSVYTANEKGTVVAHDSRTGKERWVSRVSDSITSGPTAAAGIVVVGTGEARVVALSQNNGQVLWQADVSNEILATPVIAKGRVIVKTIDGQVSAFSATTGKRMWRYRHGSPNLVLRVSSAVAVADDKVIAGFADGNLIALSLNNGSLLWQNTVALAQGSSPVEQMVDIGADPVIADGVIYVSTYQGELAAIGLSIGQQLWSHRLSSYVGLTISGNKLYITDSDSNVWSFNRNNGSVNWKQKKLFARRVTRPAVMGSTLVVGDEEGYLHWLDREDGHFLNRVYVGKSGISAAPVVDGKSVYVVTSNGMLVKYYVP